MKPKDKTKKKERRRPPKEEVEEATNRDDRVCPPLNSMTFSM